MKLTALAQFSVVNYGQYQRIKRCEIYKRWCKVKGMISSNSPIGNVVHLKQQSMP